MGNQYGGSAAWNQPFARWWKKETNRYSALTWAELWLTVGKCREGLRLLGDHRLTFPWSPAYNAISCKRHVLVRCCILQKKCSWKKTCHWAMSSWELKLCEKNSLHFLSSFTNCALGTWHWHVFLIFAFFLRHRSILLRTVASGLLQRSIYKTFDWSVANIPPWYCCVRQMLYFLNWKIMKPEKRPFPSMRAIQNILNEQFRKIGKKLNMALNS